MILVLDMDDTLITDSLNETDLPVISFKFHNMFEYNIIKRKHLEYFLEWANEAFSEVILCTYSSRKRALSILRETGLFKYFDLVFSYEDMETGKVIKMAEDFILVDDQGVDQMTTQNKLRLLGVYDLSKMKEKVLIVEPFNGFSDDVLLDIQKRLVSCFDIRK